MYRPFPQAACLSAVVALQVWLGKVHPGLSAYSLYALYLIFIYCVISPIIQTLYRWNFVMLKGLPGPESPSLLFGHMAMFYLNECDSLYYEWEQRYASNTPKPQLLNDVRANRFGLVYRIRSSFNEPELVLGDPKGISYVLSNDEKFHRSEATRQVLQSAFSHTLFVAYGQNNTKISDVFPDELTSILGEEHRRYRKLLNAAFTATAVQELSDTLFDLANQVLESWKDELQAIPSQGSIFDVSRRIQILTTDAVSRTGFAYSIAESSGPIPELLDRLRGLEDNHFTVLLQLIFNKLPFLIQIPNPLTNKWTRLGIELGRIADQVWEKGIVKKGFHSKLLDAVAQLRRDIAINHIVALLFAGSETTSNIITETLHKLSMYPHIQAKLRAELFNHRPSNGGSIGYEDLMNPAKFPYLDAIMKEALRSLTSVPQVSRMALFEDIIPLQYPIQMNGQTVTEIHVHPGQTIHMPSRDGLNSSPMFWGPTAKEFIPERWLQPLPAEVSNIRITGHILTFGDGPKICLGRLFAFAEFKIFLSTLVQHFEFLPPPDDELKDIVFHLSGPAAKPRVKGKEEDGAQLPLFVKLL